MVVERWQLEGSRSQEIAELLAAIQGALPLAWVHGRRAFPVDETVTFRRGDTLYVALPPEAREPVAQRLRAGGWAPAGLHAEPASVTLA